VIDPLLAAVVAAPDDQAAREVYGDALVERGDPRGEVIMLQLAAERLSDGPELRRVKRRAAQLVPAATAAWQHEMRVAMPLVLRRGLPWEITYADLERYLADADRLLTVRALALDGPIGTLEPLLESGAALARLHALRVRFAPATVYSRDHIHALFSADAPGLREVSVDVRGSAIQPNILCGAFAFGGLASLERLQLMGLGVSELQGVRGLRRLRHLDLDHCRLGPTGTLPLVGMELDELGLVGTRVIANLGFGWGSRVGVDELRRLLDAPTGPARLIANAPKEVRADLRADYGDRIVIVRRET
jgi:uncharacterized protein (TIGR02996 family)